MQQKLASAFAALLVSVPSFPVASALAYSDPPPLVVAAPTSSQPDGGLDATTTAVADAGAAKTPSRKYINFTGFPFPLGPFFERTTVATELVPNRVYSFEQTLDLGGIEANVRSLAFRMRDNHLLVYNPVAPTDEFMQQLASLDHAGVSHILLGATQYEHKIFVAPFARKFPDAKVWAVPDQWSFPLDLPAPLLGIDTTGSGGGELVDTATGSPAYAAAPDLTDEFEIKLLRPTKRLGFGYAANEAALWHKDTKTLALTDALVNVPSKPQPVYTTTSLLAIGDDTRNGASLGNLILRAAGTVNWRGTGAAEIEGLWKASDAAGPGTVDEQLQRGWERNALLSLYFGPSPATLVQPDASFNALADKWIVAPVTDSLIYRSERVRPELTRWVDDVAKWDFTLIAPAHFTARPGTADDLRAAFAPTVAKADTVAATRAARPFVSGDVRLLDQIHDALVQVRII